MYLNGAVISSLFPRRTPIPILAGMATQRTYLALGDSMSIDDYTGIVGGGAVKQFFRALGEDWSLDDHTFDGCTMDGVPREESGNLITLTIGGNDLLWNQEKYLAEGIDAFAAEHLALLRQIRDCNPHAVFIVGDIYHPDAKLTTKEETAFAAANEAIWSNCQQVGALLAPICRTFLGRESQLLCLQIEPNLKGASVIAELFRDALDDASMEDTTVSRAR